MRIVMIAVTGGKGGTGKSTIAVNLAAALAEDEDLLLADLDVEGPSDHILLGTPLKDEEPINIMLPIVRYQACTRCGICAQVCDTGAIITSSDGLPVIIPRLCNGCRSCYLACPANAIEEGMRTIGYTYRTEVALDGDGRSLRLVTGMLREGEEHTPPSGHSHPGGGLSPSGPTSTWWTRRPARATPWRRPWKAPSWRSS
jgi:MinD superfamily P-loop ATPase containing an inserted ferredoxin domain